MMGRIAALYRHPIKGFTPERLDAARLSPGEAFPGDRLWVVEDGPSGFDAAHPGFIPKTRFAVLHKIPDVARAKTNWDPETGVVSASAEGAPTIEVRLSEPSGRADFAAWLTELLGAAARGPLRVLEGEGWRFLDNPAGHVSILNLESVRDLSARLGRPVDPRRFRANVHVEGWPAWAENGWVDREVMLGPVRLKVVKTITRCAAPDVNPDAAVRDMQVTEALNRFYGHILCGIYAQVAVGGEIAPSQTARLI